MKTIRFPFTANLRPGTFVLALAIYLLSPGAIRAAVLSILDSIPDDSMMTFQVSDFDDGFLLNNNLVQIGPGSQQITLDDSAGAASFQASWNSTDFPSGERTIYVLQSSGGPVGEILHYSWFSEDGVGTMIGTFQSDSTAQPDLGPLPSEAYETDVFVKQGETIPFSQPSLDAGLVTETTAPEPATAGMLILGASVLGATGMRRRHRS